MQVICFYSDRTRVTVLLYEYGYESTLNLHGFSPTFLQKFRAPRETFDFSTLVATYSNSSYLC